MVEIRAARRDDAAAMSQVLCEIVAATGRERPTDVAFVTGRYLTDPASIRCSVAIVDGELAGFQSLKRAVAGNPYDVPEGWGIVGTHISPRVHRRGVGAALFRATRAAAMAAGLAKVDA